MFTFSLSPFFLHFLDKEQQQERIPFEVKRRRDKYQVAVSSVIRSIQRQQSLINHDQIIILQANGQLSFQSRSPFDNGWTADWGDGGHWGGILLLCRYLFFLVVVHHARHEHGWPVSILRRVCSMNDSSITVWCYVILSQTSVFVLLATSLEGVKNRMYLRALN